MSAPELKAGAYLLKDTERARGGGMVVKIVATAELDISRYPMSPNPKTMRIASPSGITAVRVDDAPQVREKVRRLREQEVEAVTAARAEVERVALLMQAARQHLQDVLRGAFAKGHAVSQKELLAMRDQQIAARQRALNSRRAS